MNRLSLTLRNSKAALDLASIMVGIIVIGIIGGVIAATVFAVIPWAQDNAAKASLGAVATAESAFVSSATPGSSAVYGDDEALTSAKLLPTSDSLAVATNKTGDCYSAVVKSATGKKFYITDTHAEPSPYTGSETSSCSSLADLAASLSPASSQMKASLEDPTIYFGRDLEGNAGAHFYGEVSVECPEGYTHADRIQYKLDNSDWAEPQQRERNGLIDSGTLVQDGQTLSLRMRSTCTKGSDVLSAMTDLGSTVYRESNFSVLPTFSAVRDGDVVHLHTDTDPTCQSGFVKNHGQWAVGWGLIHADGSSTGTSGQIDEFGNTFTDADFSLSGHSQYGEPQTLSVQGDLVCAVWATYGSDGNQNNVQMFYQSRFYIDPVEF